MNQDRIVAVGLLSQEDLNRLGTSFQRVFPLGQDNGFDDLLKAIDAAERTLHSGLQRQDDARPQKLV